MVLRYLIIQMAETSASRLGGDTESDFRSPCRGLDLDLGGLPFKHQAPIARALCDDHILIRPLQDPRLNRSSSRIARIQTAVMLGCGVVGYCMWRRGGGHYLEVLLEAACFNCQKQRHELPDLGKAALILAWRLLRQLIKPIRHATGGRSDHTAVGCRDRPARGVLPNIPVPFS